LHQGLNDREGDIPHLSLGAIQEAVILDGETFSVTLDFLQDRLKQRPWKAFF